MSVDVKSYLTVQALTKYIKRKFDADPHLKKVFVKGELSNVKYHPNGHIYFRLKDEGNQIDAVMFKHDAIRLQFHPENGVDVYITGYVNVYEAGGKYQLYAETMQPDGVGALYLAFEQLTEKLKKEGLFQPQWKQPLPKYPTTIGIVTATSGAAIQDIYSTLTRRFPLVKMVVFPTTVQGEKAKHSIVQSIEQANEMGNIDVLIVGRGGGSIEDLWAFNEEIVARAIFSSRIPIISAVGHETDTTIADFVADHRAPTPTAAAELAVPSQEDLLESVKHYQHRLYKSLHHKVQSSKERLESLEKSYPLQHPMRLYRPFIERFIQLEERLKRSTKSIAGNDRMHLDFLMKRLQATSPFHLIEQQQKELNYKQQRLLNIAKIELNRHQDRFHSSIRMLTALNPLQVIERGYSIIYKNEQVQNKVDQLQVGEQVTLQMQGGTATAEIQSIEKEYQDDN